jgi:HPt (histidine-containing phosphotransfer) domain-containing protein
LTAATSDISAAHDDLIRAINRLESLLPASAHSADIALLRSIVLRLSQNPSAQPVAKTLQSYDPTRFQRLLELAGPDNAAELLARLVEDLGTARQTADTAARTRDWDALRGASHVLISLTGSVGALSLQEMSERLNVATHREDASALPSMIPPLLAELDTLLAIIAATEPPKRGAR